MAGITKRDGIRIEVIHRRTGCEVGDRMQN